MIGRKIESMIRRFRSRHRTIAIIFWGSFLGAGGATIGDIHAVENVSARLKALRINHVVVSKLPLVGVEKVVPDWRQLPDDVSTVAFVCGPILAEPTLMEIMEVYRSARRVAVGVSVLESENSANTRFDEILPRDGVRGTTFDLALARFDPRMSRQEPGSTEYDLECYRGFQGEYGPDPQRLYERAGRSLAEAARRSGRPVKRMTTVIDPERNTEADIMGLLKGAGVVATTRMHASLYAIVNWKPVVAVDQVAGGAKVSAMLSAIGWPLVFRVDSLDDATLDSAFEHARSSSMSAIVERCRREAIERSARALAAAVTLITS